jgi:hypothetical protein
MCRLSRNSGASFSWNPKGLFRPVAGKLYLYLYIWGRGEAHTGFWWGNLGEGDHLEDRGLHGRIVLKWIFDKWDVDVDWIDLVQDRDRWRPVVNAGMNLGCP